MRFVRVLRWVFVCLAILAVFYAALDGLMVWAQSDCPLGMEFERTSAEVAESRAVPPMVTCRYEYFSGDRGSQLYPDEVVTHDALASWAVAAGLVAVTVAMFVLSSRRPGTVTTTSTVVPSAHAVGADGRPAAGDPPTPGS